MIPRFSGNESYLLSKRSAYYRFFLKDYQIIRADWNQVGIIHRYLTSIVSRAQNVARRNASDEERRAESDAFLSPFFPRRDSRRTCNFKARE